MGKMTYGSQYEPALLSLVCGTLVSLLNLVWVWFLAVEGSLGDPNFLVWLAIACTIDALYMCVTVCMWGCPPKDFVTGLHVLSIFVLTRVAMVCLVLLTQKLCGYEDTSLHIAIFLTYSWMIGTISMSSNALTAYVLKRTKEMRSGLFEVAQCFGVVMTCYVTFLVANAVIPNDSDGTMADIATYFWVLMALLIISIMSVAVIVGAIFSGCCMLCCVPAPPSGSSVAQTSVNKAPVSVRSVQIQID